MIQIVATVLMVGGLLVKHLLGQPELGTVIQLIGLIAMLIGIGVRAFAKQTQGDKTGGQQ